MDNDANLETPELLNQDSQFAVGKFQQRLWLYQVNGHNQYDPHSFNAPSSQPKNPHTDAPSATNAGGEGKQPTQRYACRRTDLKIGRASCRERV